MSVLLSRGSVCYCWQLCVFVLSIHRVLFTVPVLSTPPAALACWVPLRPAQCIVGKGRCCTASLLCGRLASFMVTRLCRVGSDQGLLQSRRLIFSVPCLVQPHARTLDDCPATVHSAHCQCAVPRACGDSRLDSPSRHICGSCAAGRYRFGLPTPAVEAIREARETALNYRSTEEHTTDCVVKGRRTHVPPDCGVVQWASVSQQRSQRSMNGIRRLSQSALLWLAGSPSQMPVR